MPELPEVETIVRGLTKFAVDTRITSIQINLTKVINVSPSRFKEYTLNATIKSARRRAKIIIIDLSNGYSLGIHLKMAGRLLYLKKNSPIVKHTHVIVHLDNGYDLRFWDMRQFGYVRVFPTKDTEKALKLDEFGPEPLEKVFTLDKFREMLKSRPNTRIKPLLMDQGFISGIGNLYADEILFYARIHPLRRINTLKEQEIKKIFNGIKEILADAIKKKGSSVDLYVDIEGKAGTYANYLKAYSREGEKCFGCKGLVTRIKIGSRSAYFCPKCQK